MTEGPGHKRRLRDEPDFRRYWWSRMLSLSGTVVTVVALPVLVYRLSDSAFLTALVAGSKRLRTWPLGS